MRSYNFIDPSFLITTILFYICATSFHSSSCEHQYWNSVLNNKSHVHACNAMPHFVFNILVCCWTHSYHYLYITSRVPINNNKKKIRPTYEVMMMKMKPMMKLLWRLFQNVQLAWKIVGTQNSNVEEIMNYRWQFSQFAFFGELALWGDFPIQSRQLGWRSHPE